MKYIKNNKTIIRSESKNHALKVLNMKSENNFTGVLAGCWTAPFFKVLPFFTASFSHVSYLPSEHNNTILPINYLQVPHLTVAFSYCHCDFRYKRLMQGGGRWETAGSQVQWAGLGGVGQVFLET